MCEKFHTTGLRADQARCPLWVDLRKEKDRLATVFRNVKQRIESTGDRVFFIFSRGSETEN
jgi:hypothetical protein